MTLAVGEAQISLRYSIPGSGGPAYNIFAVDPTIAGSTPAGILAGMNTVLATDDFLMQQLADDYVMDRIRIVVKSDGGPDAVTEQPLMLPGGGSGTPITSQVAVLVKKVTGFAGRAFTGRFFIPGLEEGNVDENNLINGTVLTNMQTSADDFLAAVEAEVGPMVIDHTAAIDSTPVTSLLVDQLVATQRRRLR